MERKRRKKRITDIYLIYFLKFNKIWFCGKSIIWIIKRIIINLIVKRNAKCRRKLPSAVEFWTLLSYLHKLWLVRNAKQDLSSTFTFWRKVDWLYSAGSRANVSSITTSTVWSNCKKKLLGKILEHLMIKKTHL